MEVVAVSNRTVESSQRVAAEFSIPCVHEDWNSLVEDKDIDAVVIGTWPNMHHPVTLAALASGKHVLCEARMAMNSSEARSMLDASRAHPDLVAQLVPSPLSFRVDRTVKWYVAAGPLGEPVAVDIVFRTGEFVDRSPRLDWRKDRSISGNNIIALGIWYETLMRWVGPASSVIALGQTYPTQPDEDSDAWIERVPDHVEVLADMEVGAIARIQMSSLAGLHPANEATIYGTEGTLRFAEGDLLFGKRGDENMTTVSIPESQTDSWRVEEDFIDAIRGRREVSMTDFETGVAYMEFTDAVWLSMEGGRLIRLPLDTESLGHSTEPTKEEVL